MLTKAKADLEIKNLHAELHDHALASTKDCRALVVLAYGLHFGLHGRPHETVDFDEALEHVDRCKVCLQTLIQYLPKPNYLIVELAHGENTATGFVWPFGPFSTDDEAEQWGQEFKKEAKKQGLEVSCYLLNSMFQPTEPKVALALLYRPAPKSARGPKMTLLQWCNPRNPCNCFVR